MSETAAAPLVDVGELLGDLLLGRGADGINCIVVGLFNSLAVLDALLSSHSFGHGSLASTGGSNPGAAVLDVELLQLSLLGL